MSSHIKKDKQMKKPFSKVMKKEIGEKKEFFYKEENLSKKRFANGKYWTTDDIPR